MQMMNAGTTEILKRINKMSETPGKIRIDQERTTMSTYRLAA
jgi:hypothetical protein